MSGPLVWPNGGGVEPVYYGSDPGAPFRWTSPFGLRTHPVTGQPSTFHYGLDLVGWSTVVSPVNGVVIFSGYNGGAGNEVRIREDGTGDVFRLLHNRSLLVGYGARVRAGQAVAVMGTTGSSTGVHCHFEARPGGGAAIDPFAYYRRRHNGAPAGDGTAIPTNAEGGTGMPILFYGVSYPDQFYIAEYDGRTLKCRPTLGVEAKLLLGARPPIPRGQLTDAEVVDLCRQGGYEFRNGKPVYTN